MPFNRYDDISVSTYNPRSLQETLMVPMMKRQQHDAANAQLESQMSELDKVDPLSQHFAEAQKIKADLTKKIEEQASGLATKGFDFSTTGDILKTNRMIKEQWSPTGRIGQINAAKTAYAKQMADYIEDATKTKGWSREQALKNWQNVHAPKYTGYDTQRNITQIDPYGAPIKVDRMQKLKDIKSLLGSQVVNEIGGQSFSLQPGPDGSIVAVDGSGRRIETSNKPNLAEAIKLAEAQLAPGGEWAKSIEFEGVPMQNVQAEMLHGINAMLTTDVKDTRDISHSLHGYTGKKPKEEGSMQAISEAVDTIDVMGDALGSLETFSHPPGQTTVTASGSMVPTMSTVGKTTGGTTPKEMERHFKNSLKPEQQRLYTETYNAKKAQGLIPKNATMYSKEAIDAVRKDWETKKNFSFTNNIMIPGSAGSDILASPTMDRKEGADRDAFAKSRLAVARKNNQQLLFDEKGKPVDLEDVKSVSVVGHYNPANILPSFGGNPNNTVSPHVVTWTDKDDVEHTALMPRDANEAKTNPHYNAAIVINKSVKRSASNAGNFITMNTKDIPQLRNAGLDGIRVKYDSKGHTYTTELLKDGKVLEKSVPMSSEEYQNAMYNLIP